MRFRTIALLTMIGFLAWAPPPAAASDDVQAQLREMRERLAQAEDRLQATNDQLEASKQRLSDQQSMLERSGVASGAGASSGLASFLETVEIGGWVNASYWYNVNDPDNDDLSGANTGAFSQANFYNPDANTFSLDQLWFELERPVDEGNRAGFGADIVMGKLGDLNDGFFSGSGDGQSLDEDDFYVHQAYVQYLAPIAIGDGVKIKAGKFATLIGYEVIQAPYNDQISRGIVWQNLQPIDHVGIMASTNVDSMELALGLVNSFHPLDRDTNDGKSVMGRIGFSQENWSVALNGIYGADRKSAPGIPDEHENLGVGDLIIALQPNDNLSLWANGTFLWQDSSPLTGSSGDDQHAWGAAVGARLALTERTGISVRGEYLQDDGALITGTLGPGPNDVQDVTLWSATGTIDHKLTENLMVRGEVRWDKGRIDEVEDNLFVDDSGPSLNFDADDQLLIGADVTYMFN